ncbi:hypothetical protein LINGRAHAP2_LOCUS14787 [Linum grandiflorum]
MEGLVPSLLTIGM